MKGLFQNAKSDNHIMPFLWVHGEDESVYRRMVQAIDEANMKAFCVEARPHPDFCGDGWWRDLDVILDEAEKRKMKVWILDDKHFPTGFAAGEALKAPNRLRRQSIFYKTVRVKSGKNISINLKKYSKVKCKPDLFGFVMDKINGNGKIKFDDDRLFAAIGYGKNVKVDLTQHVKDGVLKCAVPQGVASVELLYLTRNVGMHRAYINMLEAESCKILIDAVYEKHYQHYKEKFGKVIAGFFSDEPEIGNSFYCNRNNKLGQDPNLDLCWSESLEKALEQSLGADYQTLLPLLWKNDGDKDLTAKVRYAYMDCVTRLVEESFSKQIGEWCRSRGVDYIGHVIEDADLHCRTGSSLGHYFRGLKYQSMGGVDCISGQIEPQCENKVSKSFLFGEKDSEFYHYAIAKMASSLAQVNPIMNGKSFCEIFGNYGWQEGVRLEKYLVDHFMVRGVNNFVPHAFSCKPYPDKDCPPHFYAHGNNPQYRHFGELMKYTNRVCNLISNGKADTRVAVLYHGEAEWTGEAMLMQKPARVLYDNNIDFSFVPSDVFAEREFYNTKITNKLCAGQGEYQLLIVAYSQRITTEVADGIAELLKNGGKVAFIDSYPQGLCTGEELPEAIKRADCVALDQLAEYALKQNMQQIKCAPQTNRLRCMHYQGKHELWYLFNEHADVFDGEVTIPYVGELALYDAWQDTLTKPESTAENNETKLHIKLEPSKSLFIVADVGGEVAPELPSHKTKLTQFTQSVCKATDYPNFTQSRTVSRLNGYDKINKKFSGIIRYETDVRLKGTKRAVLEITDAYEGVEVFANGISLGIQVVPTFRFDLTSQLRTGDNKLVIEVATTLERERKGKSKYPTGIVGSVNLYTE